MNSFKKIPIFVLLSLVLFSCATHVIDRPNEVQRQIANSPDFTCHELVHNVLAPALATKPAKLTEFVSLSEEVEDHLYNQFVDFRKMFLFQMPVSTKIGKWSFRAKSASSIEGKLKKLSNKGKVITSTNEALKELGDGLGARVLFTRTNSAPNNLTDQFSAFVDEFADLLKRKQFKLISIENYHSSEMQPYFTDDQLEKILNVSRANGDSPNVKNGIEATSNSGYTSVHINILLPNGIKAELQVRDSLIDEISEISHIFYDLISNKEAASKVTSNPGLQRSLNVFKTMSPTERTEYTEYLENLFELVIDYSDNGSVQRSVPSLNGRLKLIPEIQAQQIAEAYGYVRIRDFIFNPTEYSERADYLKFDSVDYLMDNYPSEVTKKVIGNVSQGDDLTFQAAFINPKRKKLEKDLNGLNYIAAVPWEESSYLKKRRGLIRAHRKDPTKPAFRGNINMPKYQDGQYVGESKISVRKILYMQDSADNNSGVYTVVENAKSLKNGSLKVSDLPPLTVWRDDKDRIWSLDHRRLAAFELSGVVEEVPVRFASKEEVQGDFYKFSNADEGRSIIIQLKDDPMAYILAKPD